MDKFEKIIKESVEGFEAPYDAQAWANVSAQLGKKGGGMKWIIGSAAAVALISGTVYMMQDDTATPVDQALTENTIQPTEEVNTNPVVSNPVDMNDNFVWEFGDGSFTNSKIASHTYTRSGTYNVTLSLKDAKTNKTLSKSAVEVVVNPVPAVNFAWEQSNNLIPTINFINLTEDADKFAWDIKGVKTSTETQIDYTFRKKGTYIVELSAGNEFGCTNTIQKPIEVKSDYNLLAPTAFTPNGDNKNDYFIPEALRIMDVDFTMVVFDKSGKVMYQTTEVNMPWDGNNATDNSIAEDGAYVWKVQFKNTNGELEMYEGQVIITR
ncbi:MAG: gliding motility-associated C-terminal domain-containing protein [Crocinitomicaceae bacterium]|nr:gliding motility-associated C-terminal domain-containing protein [Crocinitomicaceae bacterium]